MTRAALARRLARRAARDPLLRRLRALARRLDRPLWVVGGWPRDVALGRAPGDFDLAVTEAMPRWRAAVAAEFGTRGFRFRKRGVTTWRFRLEGRDVDAVDAVRRGLDGDLARRDFTVNAIAFELRDGTVADPRGGLRDLRARRLRLAGARAMEEDPVRALRLARFSAALEGFRVDPAAARAARAVAPRTAREPVERVLAEWRKLLACPRPRPGLERAWDWGLVAATLPELTPMARCAAGGGRPDVWTHTGMAIEATSSLARRRVPFARRLRDPGAREVLHLALLLHDVAKPDTFELRPDGRPAFHGHETLGADRAGAALRRLGAPAALRQRVESLIRLHLRPGHLADAGPTPRALRRLARDAGDDLPLLVLHAAADALGSGTEDDRGRWRRLRRVLLDLESAAAALRRAPAGPLVGGEEVMRRLGLPPGPEVGAVLRRMVEEQDAGALRTAADARAWLDRLARESR